MGIYGIKPWFQGLLSGAERFFVRHKVHPDYLTGAALAISVLAGAALALTPLAIWLFLLVPVATVLRTALNALDGLVARGTGYARPLGEVLNEWSDRISDVAVFAGAAFARGSDEHLAAAALVAMLTSSYLGTAAKAAGGKRQYGGVMGKADRMIYLGVASIAAFALPGQPVMSYFLVIVLVGVIVTTVQRWRAIYVDLQPSR